MDIVSYRTIDSFSMHRNCSVELNGNELEGDLHQLGWSQLNEITDYIMRLSITILACDASAFQSIESINCSKTERAQEPVQVAVKVQTNVAEDCSDLPRRNEAVNQFLRNIVGKSWQPGSRDLDFSPCILTEADFAIIDSMTMAFLERKGGCKRKMTIFAKIAESSFSIQPGQYAIPVGIIIPSEKREIFGTLEGTHRGSRTLSIKTAESELNIAFDYEMLRDKVLSLLFTDAPHFFIARWTKAANGRLSLCVEAIKD